MQNNRNRTLLRKIDTYKDRQTPETDEKTAYIQYTLNYAEKICDIQMENIPLAIIYLGRTRNGNRTKSMAA